MEAKIVLKPSFSLKLETDIVEILIQESSRHYDLSCRGASREGGFIFGWRNSIDFGCSCAASFRELDTTLKILEMYKGDKMDVVNNYKKMVIKCFDVSNNLELNSIDIAL